MNLRIDVTEAREYFAHESQQIASEIKPDQLPEGDAFQYWATGGVCGIFHPSLWPGVWMAHYGVKPAAWGKTVEPARKILSAFWESEGPELIIGWTKEENRAALAFSKRLGFSVHGKMHLPSGTVIEQSWRPQ